VKKYRKKIVFLKNNDSPLLSGVDIGQINLVGGADPDEEILRNTEFIMRRDRSDVDEGLLPFFLTENDNQDVL
jgi:hypothetical protein